MNALITRGSRERPSTRESEDELEPLQLMRTMFNWDPLLALGGPVVRPPSALPAVDLRETPSAYCVVADVPGLRREDIDISVAGNRLTITGSRSAGGPGDASEKDETTAWHCCERAQGRFVRAFTLPEEVDQDGVSARLEHGVLTITLPKRAASQTRSIAIEQAEGGTGSAKGSRPEASAGARSRD